ncbi:MAG: sensor domain-containing diguanylate cyclase [Lachnospiraceae bacterium]|nr:sensor domain-containing diguanylate cyclase [Lachnospiraceae bacterium]
MKISKIMNVPILAVGLAATLIFEIFANLAIIESRKEEALYEAKTQMSAIHQQFKGCITVTDSLALVIMETQGQITDFEYIAQQIMDQKAPISSVQLAPDGKVTDIYPEEGNEAGKIDLFADPDRKEEAEYARDTGETMVAGPFELKQGGNGMAIRKPVYLNVKTDKEKKGSFWGFSVVIIMTDKLIDEAHLDHLSSIGYHYRLTASFKGQSTVVGGNYTGKFLNPVVEERQLYGKDWTLSVEPVHGWVRWPLVFFSTAALLAVTLLLAALVRSKKKLELQSEVVVDSSVTDDITGILNRSGYDQVVDRCLDDLKGKGVLVVVNVNRFRRFNDVYGRDVGDRLLVSLAADLRLMGGEGAVLGRNGGDEFQLFLMQAPEGPIFEKISAFVGGAHSFRYKGKTYKYTLSAGYAVYPDQAVDFSELCRKADRALQKSRKDENHALYQYEGT